MSRKFLTAIDMGNQPITNLLDPVNDGDAVTKRYVAGVLNGMDWKASVRVASTANINLTTGGLLTIDDVALAAGNRVLVKNQTTATQNGIYDANAAAWSRSSDADSDAEVTAGMAVFVEQGTLNGDKQWALTTDNPIVLGTTSLTFAQVGAGGTAKAAGGGLTEDASSYNVGAGNGIVVEADAVRVDAAVVGRKFTQTIGDGAATSYTVTHNLANQWALVQVYRNSSPFDMVGVDIELTSANTATIKFAVAPTASAYRVIAVG